MNGPTLVGIHQSLLVARRSAQRVKAVWASYLQAIHSPNSTSWRRASIREGLERLEPRRRKPDCFALLFTPALDPTIIK